VTHKVKAEDLYAELEKDRGAAEAKYSKGVIEVSGVVGFLGLKSAENAVVGLGRRPGEKRGTGLLCEMKGRSVIGKLAEGQEVVIRCAWRRTPVSAGLADGELLTTGPDTAIRMTAEEFAKQFTTDPQEMEKKCRDRTIILQGVVDSGPDPGGEAHEFGLKGDGKTRIRCRIEPANEKEIPVPAVGTAVTVVGHLWIVLEGKEVNLFVLM
jgi:tRNA_anti-like